MLDDAAALAALEARVRASVLAEVAGRLDGMEAEMRSLRADNAELARRLRDQQEPEEQLAAAQERRLARRVGQIEVQLAERVEADLRGAVRSCREGQLSFDRERRREQLATERRVSACEAALDGMARTLRYREAAEPPAEPLSALAERQLAALGPAVSRPDEAEPPERQREGGAGGRAAALGPAAPLAAGAAAAPWDDEQSRRRDEQPQHGAQGELQVQVQVQQRRVRVDRDLLATTERDKLAASFSTALAAKLAVDPSRVRVDKIETGGA